MMEAKTKEPKFQIGDIVSHCFRNGNIETTEICKVLFINHDRDSTSDKIYYGIFGYRPNNGCGFQLVSEDDLTLVRKWHDNIKPKEQSEWHFSQAVKVEEMPLAFINVAVRCGLIPNYPSTHGPDEIVIDKEWLDEIIAFLNKVLSDNVEGRFECKSMDDIKFYDSYSPVIPIVDLYRLVNKVLPNAIRRVISTKGATCGYDPTRHESSEHVKQSEVKSQPTYLFEMLTDKSIETMELAVELIEGLTSADILEVYQDNQSVVVTQNFVNKLCEFVNTKRHMVDRNIKFDGSDFWDNLERLNPQCFIDYVAERIIMEELKRKVLANG